MGFPSEGRGGWRHEPPANLFRLNRHSLTGLMVTGGDSLERRAVARSFHETGPLGSGPFVVLDCEREEPKLRAALESCLLRTTTEAGPNPVLAAWGGTLFLDRIASLGIETQRLILCALDHLGQAGGEDGAWPLRLGVGDEESPAAAVAGGRFLGSLYDGLDKIRVDLGQHVAA